MDNTPKPQSKQPGNEFEMDPKPQDIKNPKIAGKLLGKYAVITGGDSGIGRAIAIAFAQEGADVAILYLDEHKDALDTKKEVEKLGKHCLTISCDIGDEVAAKNAIEKVVLEFGGLDIVISNAAEQHKQTKIEDITSQQLEKTFRTNVFGMFYVIKAAMPHLKAGASVINTASVTAFKGNPELLDYSATKGAIVSFTRALSKNLIDKGIRVNAVAPGPIWTPLIAATFSEEDMKEFGKKTPMKRPGQPAEVAPCYVFLASDDASYITGEILHPNGGDSY